ncbi:signal transduction histidine kinase [Pseudarthrobacter oxydans]|uniref:histidine kinase n=1 Tax=Pseudarthrobacter oxydans TaxID=1671 RepID=A0AAW8N7A1_PSEOX|nr:ATP-binding protein [Pseudarthrobacter oxydans]MDR6791011.1 signal transduction histidine kinase [Pseudarthrobacter oxydans]MDR7162560.1 signal transduction histidine kinase [Pseudarthrobacter oxydans]
MLFESTDRYFRKLGPRGRTVMFQLPLSVTVLLVTVLVALLHPGFEWSGPFMFSLAAHLLLLAASAAVPWQRLPARAVFVIPFLDCLAIGLSRESGGQHLTVLSFLLVFPVVWLAVGLRRTGVVLAVLATILSVAVPPVILGNGFTSASFIRVVLLPVILGAIALTAFGVANGLAMQRRLLHQQEADLRDLLAASEDREQLLNTVMDTVSVGVCALDGQGQAVLVNRHLGSRLADAIGSEPTPGNVTDLPVYGVDRKHRLPPERHPRSRAARGESFTDELIWVGTGTTQRAYSVTCRLTRTSAGGNSGAVLAFTDVTALVTALSAKDEFLASVSHELRTPLTSILGYLDLALDEEGLDPGVEQCLTVAKRNARRLLTLVGDLLTIASGSLTISPRPADLNDVAATSISAAQPHAAAAGITLELESTGPATGRFDPDRLGQAIDNLVSNAIKYTPEGGTVTVRVSAAGQDLRCEVTDTGIGMTEDELAQAFTRFFRAANAHSSAIPGAGLGLAITRSIVENHRGTISLSSNRGKGTTAVLTLPDADALHPSLAAAR